MTLTAQQKGKGRLLPQESAECAGFSSSPFPSSPSSSSSSSHSSSSSESESDEDNLEDEEDDVSQEYLDSLLEKARRSIASKAIGKTVADKGDVLEEDIIGLGDPESELKCEPSSTGPGHFTKFLHHAWETLNDAPLAVRDLDAERITGSSSSLSAPALQYHHRSSQTEGKNRRPKWFDLPAPAEADLPRLYKEYEALRLRNQLDPKRFYRKDPGEGRGIKGLPKHFAIGTIIPTSTPFGGPSGDNLPRSARKRTLVDELVDDAEARHYAKRKFNELQTSRAAKGRGTLAARKAARKPKW
ncbi:Fcf2 pre-rRNA processing-domain-containing protein [Russula aff. rugulosa BPL654]|nr:Fcf2 pre-rRNA processing-domain-containing protein [Russula aff. rugulosa BPL654]